MRRIAPVLLLVAVSCGGPEPNPKSKDAYERYLGARALVETRDFKQLLPLLEDRHYLPVLGALESMADLGEPHALQHAVPLLKHEHPLVRRQACLTIGALRNEEGIPLLGAMRLDGDPGVRREAVKALARFGKRDDVTAALLEALGDKDPGVAYMAHLKLSEITGLAVTERSRDAWDRALKTQ
jgi:HEAT repeat protein